MDTTILAKLFVFVSLFLCIVLVQRKKTKQSKSHNLPPGPINLPIIGNLHNIGELPHRTFYQFSQKYGPLVYFKLGSIPTIVASSVDTAKEFMKTNDLKCCSRPLLKSLEKLSYGYRDVVFQPYGEEWRELRKICILHLFNTKKVASFRSMREEEVERMIKNISPSQNTEINLGEELMLLSNNVTCRAAFGKHCLDDCSGSKVHEILKEAQVILASFFFADYIPMLRWLDVINGMHARVDRNFFEFDKIHQQFIDAHKEFPKSDTDSGGDIIDSLLQIQRTTNEFTDEQIKGILMSIFVAGSDTSSAAIEWAMSELMRNPEAMKKAQDELRGTCMENKVMIEESEIARLPYLKCVVKETMRMHPPVPLLVPRETMQPLKVDGYDILPKTRLLINVWAIGRDPNVWENPNDFCPDRFMNSSINFLGHDFELTPFGAGRRVCPGMTMAITLIELALANLLYHFDWKFPHGISVEDMNMDESPGVTVHRKISLKLMAVKHGDV